MKDVTSKLKRHVLKYILKSLVTICFDFYTKNELFRENLGVSRNTASKYLNLLVDHGI